MIALTIWRLVVFIVFAMYVTGVVYCFRGKSGLLASLLWPLSFLAMFFLKM